MYEKGMLPLFEAGYINMSRQYLTIGVNGLVEAAESLGIKINDNPQYTAFVQQVLGTIEVYNKKYRTKNVMFNCEMIPAENVGVKHAKWDKRDGYTVKRDCYNSYFYIVEDESLNVVDKFRLHGRKFIEHLTGGSALHLNMDEHLSKAQYRQLLRVASQEGCNYFTFNIPNTVCNDCGHIDKRKLKECPKCQSKNVDYLTRIIGYMKRSSNFSQPRQEEAARRHYATIFNYDIVFQEVPGEVTLAINISNCPHRCRGCHSPQLWENKGETLDEKTLTGLLEKYGKAITCICFMGGDANPEKVVELAAFSRTKANGKIKTGWYSGNNMLPDNSFIQYFDFIKLGMYVEEFGGLASTTTNQRFYRMENGAMIDNTDSFKKS